MAMASAEPCGDGRGAERVGGARKCCLGLQRRTPVTTPAGVPTPALSFSGDHPHPVQKGGQRETLWLLSVGSWRVLNLSLSILLSHPELILPHVCLVERIKRDT